MRTKKKEYEDTICLHNHFMLTGIAYVISVAQCLLCVYPILKLTKLSTQVKGCQSQQTCFSHIEHGLPFTGYLTFFLLKTKCELKILISRPVFTFLSLSFENFVRTILWTI